MVRFKNFLTLQIVCFPVWLAVVLIDPSMSVLRRLSIYACLLVAILASPFVTKEMK